MGYKCYQPKKKPTLMKQKIALDRCYKDSTSTIRRNVLYWNGLIRPTPLSDVYSVRLQYKIGQAPKVILYGDNVKKLDDKKFPHHFKIDKEKNTVELCLYYFGEFTSVQLLADTIIPWTVEWLLHYEIWLMTGKWNGGGKH